MQDLGRERKVDLNKLSEEQLQNLQTEINKKVSQVINEAEAELNSILNIYGIGFRMVVALDRKDRVDEKMAEQIKTGSKKKTKKKKKKKTKKKS